MRQKEDDVKIQAFILSTALIVPMTLAGQTKPDNKTPQLSKNDQQFLHKLASEDQSEIQLAKLALQKSKDPEIQHYAKKDILAGDPPMEEQAKQIAQQHHSDISTTPDSMQKQEYDKLSKLSGKKFDQEYMNYESRKQAEDLEVVKNETTSTTDTEIQNYAVKEETPVAKTAQAAKTIAGSMNMNSGS